MVFWVRAGRKRINGAVTRNDGEANWEARFAVCGLGTFIAEPI